MARGTEQQDLDAIVAGGGFAGLYALKRLRDQGLDLRVFEVGDGLGGTWFWNRYPGARCDIESMFYSFSFDDTLQQEWEWSERYSTQPEILEYVDHVAKRYDLRRDIQLETRVVSAHFDDETGRWSIVTEGPAGVERWTTRFFISAVGCLSSSNIPDFPGLEDFEGEQYHTGRWPKQSPDLTGKRVGVIGTGSSGIQSIPQLAEQAEHLSVFQRTANYSVPAKNGSLAADRQSEIKADYPRYRGMGNGFGPILEPNDRSVAECTPEEVRAELDARWARGGLGFLTAFTDLLVSTESNAVVQEFVRDKIREVVDDHEYPLDVIVFATGFDAMTGSIFKIDIQGRGGLPLKKKWEAGPRTYLGLQSEGFPNLFTITGPGSPSVLSNMINAIEQHVDWISECIAALDARGATHIEPEREAEDAWVAHTNEIAQYTLYWSCSSWYLGDNIPGKPRVFMPYVGLPLYKDKIDEVVAKGYEGFEIH